MSGVKSEVIDQGALKSAVQDGLKTELKKEGKGVAQASSNETFGAAIPGPSPEVADRIRQRVFASTISAVGTKEVGVSNEPKNRGGRVQRAFDPSGAPDARGSGAGSDVITDGGLEDVIDTDFSEAELQEFLAADYLDTQADPAFKESLRKKLWALVSHRYGRGPSSVE